MLTPNIRVKLSDNRELNILNTAMNLFIRVGMEKVTMSHILKSSGVSKSSLYRFFESKKDLMAGLLMANEQELAELLSQLRNEQDSSVVIEQYVKFRLQSFDKYKVLYRIEKDLVLEDSQLQRFQDWKKLRAEHVDTLVNMILGRSGRRSGESQRFYYGYLWTLIHGVAFLSESPFFHELIDDRRAFMAFITDISKKMLEG